MIFDQHLYLRVLRVLRLVFVTFEATPSHKKATCLSDTNRKKRKQTQNRTNRKKWIRLMLGKLLYAKAYFFRL